MKLFLISVLTVLFFITKADAQLFKKHELYPTIKTVKGKYYNGSGGGGYWSIAKLDTLGRTIIKESYRKKILLARDSFVYNSNDDLLYHIVTFDINNPNRIDIISRYEYKYQDNIIVYQKEGISLAVIELIKNKADTLIYQTKYSYPKRMYILKNGLLVYSENYSEGETTYFEYYPNGRLKRRKIEREPPISELDAIDNMYVGGPGSDDEFYKYKFDKSGRIKTFYRIIGKKKYKIATYRYEE